MQIPHHIWESRLHTHSPVYIHIPIPVPHNAHFRLYIPYQRSNLQFTLHPSYNLIAQSMSRPRECEFQDPQDPTNTESVVHAGGKAIVKGWLRVLTAGLSQAITVAGRVMCAVEVWILAQEFGLW